MTESKKFQIPAFEGVQSQGFDRQSVSFVVHGSTRSRSVGASWAKSAYLPIVGDLVGNHIRKLESTAAIEQQAREMNQEASNDNSTEMIDIGEVLAGARETMAVMDDEMANLAKGQAEEDYRRSEEANLRNQHESHKAQLVEQRAMLTALMPPLLAAGAGLSWFKHTRNFGTSILVGVGAWIVGTRIAPRIAHGAQQIHQTGVVPVLSAGAQVAGMAKRVA